MSNYPYVDVNGVLEVEKNYLRNINSQDNTGLTSKIQNDLNNLYSSYKSANASTDSVITQQNKVLDIVNTEHQRLKEKKQSVDNAMNGQKRILDLTDSNRLRQQSYTKLLVIFIITLVLFVGIMILSKYLPFIPEIVFELLAIIIISVSIYNSLYLYIDIQSRSNMNFNELDIPQLNNSVAGNAVVSGQGSGSITDLLTGLNGCKTSDCCGPQTIWDNVNNVCIPITTTISASESMRGNIIQSATGSTSSSISGFTTMSVAYLNDNNIDVPIKKLSPNNPYEFEKYTPVN